MWFVEPVDAPPGAPAAFAVTDVRLGVEQVIVATAARADLSVRSSFFRAC